MSQRPERTPTNRQAPQVLRKLINRVDSVVKDINYGVYEDQEEVRAKLIEILLGTGLWQQ